MDELLTPPTGARHAGPDPTTAATTATTTATTTTTLRRSPTLEELLPPIQPRAPFVRRHRTGVIFGAVSAVLIAIGCVVIVLNRPDDAFDAKPGQCLDGQLTPNGTVGTIKVIPCTTTHYFEVFGAGESSHDIEIPEPGDLQIDPEVARICGREVDPAVRKALLATSGASETVLFAPDQHRRLLCVVFTVDARNSSIVAAALD
ncbi:MAG: hypothetical protein JWM34_3878 [Ilumatobacteraceae bacterium]|nr:hypothetical protein [Ilumatobacteraceae bacterium]